MPERSQQAIRTPPGRHPLSREFISQHQRARIIAALAEETEAQGYRAVTVADIVRRAGIARNTFYENFSSKQGCFLAAYEHGAEEALRRVVEAAGEVETWPGRVYRGLGAFLGYVAAEPALARTCIVEVLSAGPEAVERNEESMRSFVPLLRMGRKFSPSAGDLPDTLEETIVGGLFWIIYQRLVSGRAETIEELLPELTEFALTPYVGAEAAKRTVAEQAAAASA